MKPCHRNISIMLMGEKFNYDIEEKIVGLGEVEK